MCKSFFEELGFEGIFATDGVRAIEIYRDEWQSIDLVVLDMMMPKMNGSQVFEKLKKINSLVRVIVSSGFSLDNSIPELHRTGALYSLKKPFKLIDFKQAIEKSCSC